VKPSALTEVLNRSGSGDGLARDDLVFLLSLEDPGDLVALFAKAYEVKEKQIGRVVHFRGLVELSNVCTKDCNYCGIRRSNRRLARYEMSVEEILEAARWAREQRYGSLVLQSGERQDERFIGLIEEAIRRIQKETDGTLGITLCLGEQDEATYRRWFEAGALRYLLRIETSNPELYARVHPRGHDFDTRRRCLEQLKSIGYQVGTGVLIGLPGQTVEDLAEDILFFKSMDADMIGMGPYLPHGDTPLGETLEGFDPVRQINLGLKMIAVARLALRDVNIASTTALQALDPQGRERGLLAGANVMMPNITPTKYRSYYQLYEGKPCLDENASECRGCLEGRIAAIGEKIGYGEPGNPKHFYRRISKSQPSASVA
jgi:biotin synthase